MFIICSFTFQYAKRKAGELEDDFGNNDDDSEEAVKKRKLEKQVSNKDFFYLVLLY